MTRISDERILRDLLTDRDRERLFENGRRRNKRLAEGQEPEDEVPLVLLFTPDANWRWLLTHMDPVDNDLVYGLIDAGMGFPDFEYVSLAELANLRGSLGLPVQRHPHFAPDRTISRYAEEAQKEGRITYAPISE